MPETIRGVVAKLITGDELVINRGSLDGVAVGMRFVVLDPKTEDITDPETGENLGSVPRAKARVRVTNVSDRLALAERVVANALIGLARAFEPSGVRQVTPMSRTSSGLDAWPDGVLRGDPVHSLAD